MIKLIVQALMGKRYTGRVEPDVYIFFKKALFSWPVQLVCFTRLLLVESLIQVMY